MRRFSKNDFSQMQDFFLSGATISYQFRIAQLKKLRKAIESYEHLITAALFKDLHKSTEEAFTTEIGFVYSEISHVTKNLTGWMEGNWVKTPMVLFPSTSKIIREPLGICLIIAPWNYPFQLLIAPLIGAIAGGNCAVLKPSEMTVNTSQVIAEMIGEFFDKNYLTVVEGDGAEVVPQMMNENRFDHVFFTGSIPVGREIAKMAAEKLVPVTLELGGKSPCIVDKDADIKVAAKRITWGKFTNAGQTRVAPDYVLVHQTKKEELVAEIQKSITNFYGTDPQQSIDFGRIVNEKRVSKLESYLQQGTVITGGKVVMSDLYVSPTLMQDVSTGAHVMKEEIFGPILPIISFAKNEEALNIINDNPNPLSLYYFGKNNEKTFY
jgi:aldehyde dehydrogenase (NAD+)